MIQIFYILDVIEDTKREEKKIEQSNGKLLRRKVMRRKRPLPTPVNPLPYQGNRRIASQPQQFAPNFNLTVNTHKLVKDTNAIKKIRRKKIPVTISSSKVVTYKPKTTPMMPTANTSFADQDGALNRTEEEKRCKYYLFANYQILINFLIIFKYNIVPLPRFITM